MPPPSSGSPASVRGYMPPPLSGGNVHLHMGDFSNIDFSSHGFPNMQIPMHPYMNQFEGGYFPTSQGHGLYQNPPFPMVSNLMPTGNYP